MLMTQEALQRTRLEARARSHLNSRDSSSRDQHPMEQELSRRKSALLFYLLRTPLFHCVSKPFLTEACTLTSNIPLVGGLMKKLLSMCNYLNDTHFYTSASS